MLSCHVNCCCTPVRRVADAGAVAALADARVAARFTAVRVLNLSNAGLTALPASVGLLTGLEVRLVVVVWDGQQWRDGS